jgi:pimeloyl-ACP methyl ester carboxylesterase
MVPIDYGRPQGLRATVALIRIRATGVKIGSLVVNPGGPGASGVDLAAGMAEILPAPLRERFDLVGFDPRGVGYSQPAVRCLSDAEIDQYRAEPFVDYTPDGTPGVDYSPAGVQRNEDAIKRVVQQCVDKMGKEFLANVGTANVVRDLEALRSALGENQLTYVGFSYGTEIGALYAEAYPANVRAMLLDGAVDLSVARIDEMLAQAAAFQVAFNDFAADCAQSADCPLGNDADKAVAVFRSLVDPLVQRPAPTTDRRGLSYKDAVTGTLAALYSPGYWATLTRGLTALRQGANGDDLLHLADGYMQRSDDGTYANLTDAYTAITCADRGYPTDQQSWAQADQRMRGVARFQTFGQYTGFAPRGTCAFWPVPASLPPHRISAAGLPPVVVIATTHDPATPYEGGVHLAEQLRAALLTVQGTKHTVAFDGNRCVDDIVTRFLTELTMPPPGSRCAL